MSEQHRGHLRRAAAWTASTALVTASVVGVLATPASASSHSSKGYLQVCLASTKALSHRFHITGNGINKVRSLHPSTASASCSTAMHLPKGTYKVRETVKSGESVSNISVAPSKSGFTRDVVSATSSVGVSAGASTAVTYYNKPAKATTPPPPPPPSDPGTGYLEVCKKAGDAYVNGTTWTINVTDESFSTTRQVLAGQCTEPIQVPAGQAVISETPQYPFYLSSVVTSPSSALVSTDLANSSAIVSVVQSADSSNETLATLVNSTKMGYFKICKTLASNTQDLVDSGHSTFTFDPSYALAGSSTYTALASVPVKVLSAGDTQCVIDPTPLPLGTVVKVSEESFPNTVLTGVSVQPASQNAGSTATTALLTVGPNQNGITTATFTNAALGTLEICKKIDDSNWKPNWSKPGEDDWSPYNGTPFTFVINGSKNVVVRAGQCSAPIQVPAGTATVQELATANFSLESFTAVGPDGSSRLISGTNPITVSVPWGGLSNQGVGNETLVTATNKVNIGQVKVCKMVGPLVTVTKKDGSPIYYTFTVTFHVGTHNFSQQVSLAPTADGPDGEVCGWLSGPLPVINPDGSAVSFTVTEGASPFPATTAGTETVEPTDIEYAGNGTLIARKVFQSSDTTADDGTYFGTATIGQGVNAMIFTNSNVVDP